MELPVRINSGIFRSYLRMLKQEVQPLPFYEPATNEGWTGTLSEGYTATC